MKIFLRVYPDKKLLVESFWEALKQIPNATHSSNKSLENIIINEDMAINNFGEELFALNIKNFVDDYDKTKKELITYYNDKDFIKLKMISQTLKTTVRYIYNIKVKNNGIRVRRPRVSKY